MRVPTNKEELLKFLTIKDILDEKILQIALMNKPSCYDNLDSWEIEDDMIYVITDEYWSDGTHDYEHTSFPIEYLFVSEDEVKTQIEIALKKAKLEKEKYDKLKKENELKIQEEKERAEYERLKAKFS